MVKVSEILIPPNIHLYIINGYHGLAEFKDNSTWTREGIMKQKDIIEKKLERKIVLNSYDSITNVLEFYIS